MTCTCSTHSPFRFDVKRDSIFMSDSRFYKGAAMGKTPNQIATEVVERVTAATGRNPGSIQGISSHSDRLIEQSIYDRRAKRG